MGEAGGPLGREAHGAAGGHLDEGQHLAGLNDQGVVAAAADLEGAPEPHALDGFETAVDYELIAEDGGLPVVDLCADYDGVLLDLGHGAETETHLLGEVGAGYFDET